MSAKLSNLDELCNILSKKRKARRGSCFFQNKSGAKKCGMLIALSLKRVKSCG